MWNYTTIPHEARNRIAAAVGFKVDCNIFAILDLIYRKQCYTRPQGGVRVDHNGQQWCDVANTRIAALFSISVSTVKNTVNKFAEAGLLELLQIASNRTIKRCTDKYIALIEQKDAAANAEIAELKKQLEALKKENKNLALRVKSTRTKKSTAVKNYPHCGQNLPANSKVVSKVVLTKVNTAEDKKPKLNKIGLVFEQWQAMYKNLAGALPSTLAQKEWKHLKDTTKILVDKLPKEKQDDAEAIAAAAKQLFNTIESIYGTQGAFFLRSLPDILPSALTSKRDKINAFIQQKHASNQTIKNKFDNNKEDLLKKYG